MQKWLYRKEDLEKKERVKIEKAVVFSLEVEMAGLTVEEIIKTLSSLNKDSVFDFRYGRFCLVNFVDETDSQYRRRLNWIAKEEEKKTALRTKKEAKERKLYESLKKKFEREN